MQQQQQHHQHMSGVYQGNGSSPHTSNSMSRRSPLGHQYFNSTAAHHGHHPPYGGELGLSHPGDGALDIDGPYQDPRHPLQGEMGQYHRLDLADAHLLELEAVGMEGSPTMIKYESSLE